MQDVQAVDPQEFKLLIGQGRKKYLNVKTLEPDVSKNDNSSSDTEVDIEQLTNELKKYNNQLQYSDKEIKLSINQDIDRVVVTVVNKNTNEVIYEYPYKELQKLAAHLKDLTGVMFDVEG